MTLRPFESARRQLLAAVALAVLPSAHAAGDDRHSALQAPALAVRKPGQAVLQAVAVAGTRLIAVGERGIVALSDDAAKTWHQAHRVPTSVTLTAVRFADSQRGWAVGHGGVILATQDGGEQWTLQADGRHLAALAESAARTHPDQPALAKEAAQLVADGPDKPLLDLHVTDAQHLFVVGAYNLAFESNDGGGSWRAALDRMDNPKSQHLYGLAVRGHVRMIAGEQGLLMRSRDGGQSFQRLVSPYAGSWFALTASGQNEWIVAGLRGHVFRSTDDGDTWAPLEGAPPTSLVSAVSQTDGTVLLANQAGQLYTTRSGSALTPVPVPSLPPLTQAVVLPDGDLLALSMVGALRLPRKAAI